MDVFTVISTVLILGSALAEEGSLLLSCNRDDIGCLNKSMRMFLEKSQDGIPAYDIKAIDPLLIKPFDFVTDSGIAYKLKNITITGLKNQNISKYIMDTNAKSVVLSTNADLKVTGDVDISLPKPSKTYSGTFTSDANVICTANYNYELSVNDKGVRHFDVGPETTTCKVLTATEPRLNPELQQALSNDEDLAKYSKSREEARAKSITSMLDRVANNSYKVVMQNLRTVAKVLPASAFFKDI